MNVIKVNAATVYKRKGRSVLKISLKGGTNNNVRNLPVPVLHSFLQLYVHISIHIIFIELL
jgi:hypothetical protein